MEFKMTNEIQALTPHEIKFNFEELKAELDERLGYYRNLVITEDGVKEGKEDLAKMRKLREAIETRRKDVKKEYLKPYNEFELKCKELVALIDEPINAVNNQLKGFDEAKKAEKWQEIQEYYSATVAPYLQTVIPLERIQKPDWLNATKNIKKVQLEIVEAVAKVTADLEVINTMPTDDYTAAVRAEYMNTLDITAALAKRKSLQAAAEAFKQAGAPQVPVQEKEAPVQTAEPVAQPAVEERLYTLRLEMHLTKAQAECLKKYLIDNGIDHYKI